MPNYAHQAILIRQKKEREAKDREYRRQLSTSSQGSPDSYNTHSSLKSSIDILAKGTTTGQIHPVLLNFFYKIGIYPFDEFVSRDHQKRLRGRQRCGEDGKRERHTIIFL